MNNKLIIIIISILTLISIGNPISFIFFYCLLAFIIMLTSCSALSNIDNYQHFYLINQNKEYLNILILNNNHEYGSIYYTDKLNNEIEYKIKKLNKLDGYFKAETKNGKKLSGYMPNKNSGFEGTLDNNKVYFNYPDSYTSETNIIQHICSHSIGKAKINYEIFLFLLNNTNNLKSINIINSDINKEYGITETSNITDQKEIYDILENHFNKKIQTNFVALQNEISHEEIVYNIRTPIPNITFFNDEFVSISSSRIFNNAVYYLNTGDKLKITDIITDTNKCLTIIKNKLNDNQKILESNKFDNLENSYFYLTSYGINFDYILSYKDSFINEKIDYISVFIEAEKLKDIINYKYKNIFN